MITLNSFTSLVKKVAELEEYLDNTLRLGINMEESRGTLVTYDIIDIILQEMCPKAVEEFWEYLYANYHSANELSDSEITAFYNYLICAE